MSMPIYLSCHIRPRNTTHPLHFLPCFHCTNHQPDLILPTAFTDYKKSGKKHVAYFPFLTCLLFSFTHFKGDASVLLVEHQICDSQVVGLSPGWASPCSGFGQATYTCVALSPSSIIWQWCSLAGKVTACLADSNGSLMPGLLVIVSYLQADCQGTGFNSKANAH